ncbi:MAG: hypothetical protein CMJ83_16995 [Planctomycetes bacterium]|nr:hypothetical protein [Planctomycetota bacterium]
MVRFLVLLLVIAAAPDLPAQKKCYVCKGEGFIVCKKKQHNAKKLCGKWKFEHKCSAVLTASCCRGLQKVHCTRCNDPIAEAEILEEIDQRKLWVDRQKAWMKPTNVRVATIETKEFILHFSIPRWSGKGMRYTRSKAAHLFAYRLQTTADRFREITGVLPHRKQRMYMVASGTENSIVTVNKMGGGYTGPFRRSGLSGSVCTWPDPRNPRLLDDDKNMHSHVVHMGTHLLHRASHKFNRENPPWLSCGLSHWMDLELTEQTRDFCFNERSAKSPWNLVEWKTKIYGEVASRREIQFAEVIAKKTLDQTDHRDHAYAYSYIDFMISAYPAKFKAFYKSIKSSNSTKKAIDDVFNWSTSSFHDYWRKWVIKNYARK